MYARANERLRTANKESSRCVLVFANSSKCVLSFSLRGLVLASCTRFALHQNRSGRVHGVWFFFITLPTSCFSVKQVFFANRYT